MTEEKSERPRRVRRPEYTVSVRDTIPADLNARISQAHAKALELNAMSAADSNESDRDVTNSNAADRS